MKAALNDYRQAPRKVALVAGLVRGKTVVAALQALQFAPKRASAPVEKLIRSAVANAATAGITDINTLKIQEIQVNKAVTLKRIMPRAFGSASRINKRSSHVTVILSEIVAKPTKAEKAAAVKEVKAPKAEKTAKAKTPKAKK